MFHGKRMKQTCACGGENRPGQGNCYRCHALANQVYRARVKHSAERLHRMYLRLMSARLTLYIVPETCKTVWQ